MREININIEGYNVNGICVGCLNYNRKMFYCDQIKECFKLLGNIDVPDGLQVQVCWECLASVQAALRFRNLIIDSYNVLIDYSRKHTFLNSPSDLSMFARQRFNTTDPEVSTLQELVQIEVDVSVVKEETKEELVDPEVTTLDLVQMEVDVSVVKEETKEELVEESGVIKSETDYFDTADFPDALEDPASSEDDVQLSKLKRKKDRKIRKVKKREGQRSRKIKVKTDEIKTEKDQQRDLRKLKNLPADLVELYTMTEEEMWEVRAEDVSSAEFCALKYKCADCVIGFNSERLMLDHMQGKHVPKGPSCQQCDVCRAYFLTADNVWQHRARHLAAYRCGGCGARTALKRRMLAHARTHRALHATCHTCGEQFSTQSKLSYHRGVCKQERPQCDCCGKVFANKMTLKYHLKILPQNKEEKPKEKLFINCKGCDKVFHTKKSYRAHVVIHNGLTYPCPICGKLFQWKRNLARHTRNHRDRDAGATHECRDCGKTFSSRDCYNNHMKLSKRHVQEDAYVHECSYCGKKFATKWCMVDHIDWDHLKRIKYQCSVCFKAFKTAKIMVAHMNNIHEGKKNREPEGEHLCEVCGKSYKTVKRLKGHVWAMHTNRSTTKSFKCKLCPATFTWQTSIYKHVKMMHQKPPIKIRTLPAKKQEFPNAGLIAREYFQPATGLTHIPIHNIVQNIV